MHKKTPLTEPSCAALLALLTAVAVAGAASAGEPGAANDTLAIAPKLALAMPASSKLGGGLASGLAIDYTLPWLDRHLRLAAELAHTRMSAASRDTQPSVGEYRYRLTEQLSTASVEAQATTTLGAWQPYVGVGWAVYLLQAQLAAFGAETREAQGRNGVLWRTGCARDMGAGQVFADLSWMPVRSSLVTTGRAHANLLTLAFGYRFRLW
jgi:hypothetical protein